jgi:uncharacterized phage-associated protein
MFTDQKVGQMAAFFANAAGGTIPVLKLVKLIYLADREFLEMYGMPITYDRLVAMPHGPVNSRTYDFIQGATEAPGWDAWISGRRGHDVSLTRPVAADDLDELSKAEIEALQIVWKKFGAMGRFEIRDWTHDHCSEWKDPNGSSRPIAFREVLRAVGYSAEKAKDIEGRIEEQLALDRVFSLL